MEKIKILFIGVGSIARRHINNLYSIGKQNHIEFTIDAYRRKDIDVDGVRKVFTNIRDVPDDYDAVFITNPTEYHLSSLEQFYYHGKNFFIEKPVVSISQLDSARLFKPKQGAVYYVACPLRYSSVIQYIKYNIDPRDVLSVRSISSSYLPEWRPGQDYRETYSAHKELGGGVSVDLIHEWDYLTYIFGWPNKVLSIIGKKSKLEIDSDDCAIYIAEYEDKIIELHLDYFGRINIREVQLLTKDETITGDLVNNRIYFLNRKKEIVFHEKRDDYQKRELMHFLNMINTGANYTDGFSHGMRVLQLTQGGCKYENNG